MDNDNAVSRLQFFTVLLNALGDSPILRDFFLWKKRVKSVGTEIVKQHTMAITPDGLAHGGSNGVVETGWIRMAQYDEYVHGFSFTHKHTPHLRARPTPGRRLLQAKVRRLFDHTGPTRQPEPDGSS
jgi:hypothetical protein